MTEHGEGGKSAADLFNEKPSWYDEPELSDAQLDPNYVPPRHARLGDTAGMASIPTRKPANVGRRAELIWGFIFLFVLGGGTLIAMLAGVFGEGLAGSDGEFAIGECRARIAAENSIGLATNPDACSGDDFIILEVFEADGFEQMPSQSDQFWVDAFNRCLAQAEASGVGLPVPAAATNAAWADGNRTVVCIGTDEQALVDLFDLLEFES